MDLVDDVGFPEMLHVDFAPLPLAVARGEKLTASERYGSFLFKKKKRKRSKMTERSKSTS